MTSSASHLAPSSAGCLIRITSAFENFKPAEKTVGSFILENPQRVMQMSISELARDANVGESTIIRFCRTLSYKGYQEFKLRLAQDLVQPVGYIHENISFDDTVPDLTHKIFQTNLNAVERTAKSLDPVTVERAAKAIVKARKINLYGVASSFMSALDARLKFMRLGLTAEAFGDGHLQAMAASLLSPEDVAIGISHSGSTKDVVESLTWARKSGATIVSVTNFSPSPIAKVSDMVLLTASSETPLGGSVLTSRIAQLCVIDVLSAAIAVVLGEGCLEQIAKVMGVAQAKRY